MNKLKHNSLKSGFTIIEVVLVLAIAGLIFLMVFIALPALQRSQRDSQRKNQAQTVIDGAIRKIANNKGSILLDSTGWSIGPLISGGCIKEDEIKDPITGGLSPTPIDKENTEQIDTGGGVSEPRKKYFVAGVPFQVIAKRVQYYGADG